MTARGKGRRFFGEESGVSCPLTIRLMTEADIPAGMRFKRQARWNQTEADWKRFLALNPRGCFVGCVDQQPVATVTTAVFGPVGWIAMVLVDVEHRGQGFARRMLDRAVDHLNPQVETIKLDATELGRPLYEKLGFRPEFPLTRYQYRCDRPDAVGLACQGVDLPDALLAMDAAVYGSDRSRLLRRLADEGHPQFVVTEGESVTGYAILRPGENALHFGPAIAETTAAYRRIVDWVQQRVSGICFLDVLGVCDFRDRIRSDLGLVRQRDFLRMYRGSKPFSGRPSKVVATSGPEMG